MCVCVCVCVCVSVCLCVLLPHPSLLSPSSLSFSPLLFSLLSLSFLSPFFLSLTSHSPLVVCGNSKAIKGETIGTGAGIQLPKTATLLGAIVRAPLSQSACFATHLSMMITPARSQLFVSFAFVLYLNSSPTTSDDPLRALYAVYSDVQQCLDEVCLCVIMCVCACMYVCVYFCVCV